MRYGMNYKRGDLILIPFPFTDLSGIKKRPGIIISPDWYNERYEDVVVVAVTTKFYDNKVQLSLKEGDLYTGNIPKDSYIRFTKIFTFNKSEIIKVLAVVNENKFKEIMNKVREFFSN